MTPGLPLARTGGVEHGMEILHLCLQRRKLATVVRQTGSPLVEQDQPKRLGKSQVEAAPPRIPPGEDEVLHVVGHVNQVGLTVPDSLVAIAMPPVRRSGPPAPPP